MCGFAGAIDSSGETDRLGSAVDRMAETLRHRGPDDAGLWVDEAAGVALGFRRLAILDLSAAGHQPMISRTGRFVLVLNGEIYNHTDLRAELAAAGYSQFWAGHSDTETLLASFTQWGVNKTLERTVGMFALALWDRHERRLYLARDRFGEKPLYYGWTTRSFIFGSELKALSRYPRFNNEIDRDVLALYMQYSCVPAPYSIYQSIYKLEPGCVMSLMPADGMTSPSAALFAPARYGQLTLERYWSLSAAAQKPDAPLRDEREAITCLEATLSNAVRLQSTADVPLGAFLSGGVDSSTVVALMQSLSTRQVKTFTIGFDEASLNEASYAKAVAQHLGTDHTEQYVSARQAREVIPKLPDLYSEPFADSSQIPTHLVSQIARRHVTVALSGDGGDELFGGYTRHMWASRVWRGLRWLPPALRRTLGHTLQRVPFHVWHALGNGLPGEARISRLGDKTAKLASRLTRMNDLNDVYLMLLTAWPSDTHVVLGARHLSAPLDMKAVGQSLPEPERMMLWDALSYLPDTILQKVDRASMGVGLETRTPYLDHRVAELVYRLPLNMKIRHQTGKWILRQVLYRYVPSVLIERPKMGFAVPLDDWLRGPLRDWAEALISESSLKSGGYLDSEPIRQRWAEHMSGRRNWSQELWTVLMFQSWLQSRPASVGPPVAITATIGC
jgi:asparagine synthase (glutamine-hydrolysing)